MVRVAQAVPSLVFGMLSVARTQTLWAPVLRAPKPETATGLSRFVVVPSPSWPERLSPQQRTVPSARSAQVW